MRGLLQFVSSNESGERLAWLSANGGLDHRHNASADGLGQSIPCLNDVGQGGVRIIRIRYARQAGHVRSCTRMMTRSVKTERAMPKDGPTSADVLPDVHGQLLLPTHTGCSSRCTAHD